MGLIIFLFLVGEAVDSLFLKKYNARIAEQRRAERLAARRLDAWHDAADAAKRNGPGKL